MAESNSVNCPIHGPQDETFVCQHIVTSLHTGEAVGFCWSSEDSSPRPDAWCSECEAARADSGEDDWTEELTEMLGVKLLCGACYDHARNIWKRGQKVTQ
jgi:hypothetical protein